MLTTAKYLQFDLRKYHKTFCGLYMPLFPANPNY
uniref:Uncharacterized protein n=1 Tax=Myoviridae sp. ctgpD8 TaxID=2825149 RepID=A0A8S5QJ20_9CAUD|nr:MAG TPA: hypothetical protein [Myoviridae sp. ctgpD8]